MRGQRRLKTNVLLLEHKGVACGVKEDFMVCLANDLEGERRGLVLELQFRLNGEQVLGLRACEHGLRHLVARASGVRDLDVEAGRCQYRQTCAA